MVITQDLPVDSKPVYKEIEMRQGEVLDVDRGKFARRPSIGLANDHAGVGLRLAVLEELAFHADQVLDVGVTTEDPVDFPDITARAVKLIQSGHTDRVILLCGTGAGACIAANKFKGIRAAVAHDTYVARQSVVHDDVNVLCLGAWITGPQIALDIIRHFLAAQFSDDENFRRRVAKLTALEESESAGRPR
jgi:ribose 5-phosphate isomerase B